MSAFLVNWRFFYWIDKNNYEKLISNFWMDDAMDWKFVIQGYLPEFIFWNLNPQGDGGEVGHLGGDQVMKVEASWLELVPSQKRPHWDPSPLQPYENRAKMHDLWAQKWDFTRYWNRLAQASRTVRNKFLLYTSSLVYGISVEVAWVD